MFYELSLNRVQAAAPTRPLCMAPKKSRWPESGKVLVRRRCSPTRSEAIFRRVVTRDWDAAWPLQGEPDFRFIDTLSEVSVREATVKR